MTKDEALKMAIEALEDASCMIYSEFSIENEYEYEIKACKEALEQKTVLERDYNFMRDLAVGLEEALEQSTKEPVYLPVEVNGMGFTFNCKPLFDAKIIGKYKIKLEVDND